MVESGGTALRQRRVASAQQSSTFVAATIVGMIALAAPAAHADNATDQFIADEHAQGYFNVSKGDAGLIAQGMVVCNDLDKRMPLDELTVAFTAAEHWSTREAVEFMGIAIRDLCPRHLADVQREAEGN